MPLSNYLPKVLYWCSLDFAKKGESCPRMYGEVKFHGDTGDWISNNGFETLCVIAAEICRGSRAVIEDEPFEEEAERLLYDLSRLLEDVGSELHEFPNKARREYEQEEFHHRCVAFTNEILSLKFCYSEDTEKSWSEMFDEWSYGAYSLSLQSR